MEEYNLPLWIEEQTKGVLCYSKQPGTPKFWPPLRPLHTSPDTVRFNNACDHCAVTISHTCCCLTCVTGTLLTLMHCGTSLTRQAPLDQPQIIFAGGKKYMLEVVSHKPRARGRKGCTAFALAPSQFSEEAFYQRHVNQTGYLLLSFD